MKNFLIKLTAWFILIISILFGLGFFALVVLLSIYIKEMNMIKLALVDMGLILFGLLFIALGLGFFEGIYSLLEIEEEIEGIVKKEEDEI